MTKKSNLIRNKHKEKEYWQDRAINSYLLGEKSVLKVARHLNSLYNQTSKLIDDKIYSFYGKYASDNNFTIDEAMQLLNKNEFKDFKSYIYQMLRMGKKENFSADEMNEFKRLYVKAKITRLEELQANIRSELDKLAFNTVSNVKDLLTDTYENNYYETMYNLGFTGTFSGLNTQAVEKAIKEKYTKANYSIKTKDYEQGIWYSTNQVMNILTNEIPKGLVLGYNPRKLAREVVNKRVDKTLYNNTVRLMRTEYSHILNQSTLDAYMEAGVTQYQILTALDSRTCDDCADYEGKLIDVNDVIEGINIPPFHPNCRCTTIPYFPEDEIDEMNDEELDNIGFVTYDDWKDGLTQLENDQVIYNWNKGIGIQDLNGYEPVSTVLRDKLIEICDNLPEKDKLELSWYTSDGYKVLNKDITTVEQATKERIANFEEVLAKGKLEVNSILYRGLEEMPSDLLKGFSTSQIKLLQNYQSIDDIELQPLLNRLLGVSYIDDETFVSTSIDRNVAIKNFAVNQNKDIGFLVEIKANSDTQGIYVDKISANKGEKEFIINNGYKYTVDYWQIIDIEEGKLIKLTVSQSKE